jgi:hypothetical protein
MPMTMPNLPLLPKATTDPLSKNPPSHTKQSRCFLLINPTSGRMRVGGDVVTMDIAGDVVLDISTWFECEL